MTQPRAADDFTTIRARLEELRRENARAAASDAAPEALASGGEQRQKERREDHLPPWVSTVFIKPSGGRR